VCRYAQDAVLKAKLGWPWRAGREELGLRLVVGEGVGQLAEGGGVVLLEAFLIDVNKVVSYV
jgi:hypothetical protein